MSQNQNDKDKESRKSDPSLVMFEDLTLEDEDKGAAEPPKSGHSGHNGNGKGGDPAAGNLPAVNKDGELKKYHSSEVFNPEESEEGEGGAKRGRIGDRMVKAGIITPDQLNVALQEKKISGKMLGQIIRI